MSLGSKIILILLTLFMLLTWLNSVVLDVFIMPEFFKLEEKESKNDAKRIVRAIEREVSHLASFCLDWSALVQLNR